MPDVEVTIETPSAPEIVETPSAPDPAPAIEQAHELGALVERVATLTAAVEALAQRVEDVALFAQAAQKTAGEAVELAFDAKDAAEALEVPPNLEAEGTEGTEEAPTATEIEIVADESPTIAETLQAERRYFL